MMACKCFSIYYFVSTESSTPSITIEPKFFWRFFSFITTSWNFPQGDKITNIKCIYHRCRVVSLGQKTLQLIHIILVTQNRIEIYEHVSESEIELTEYEYSLFTSTVDLYSPVNVFPYLLPCLQLASMTAMGSVTKIKECNYHLKLLD